LLAYSVLGAIAIREVVGIVEQSVHCLISAQIHDAQDLPQLELMDPRFSGRNLGVVESLGRF
jgi:hypothetical protein